LVEEAEYVAIEMVGIRIAIAMGMMIMSGNGGMAGISGAWACMRAGTVWNFGMLRIWRLRWTRKLVYILTAVVVMIDDMIAIQDAMG